MKHDYIFCIKDEGSCNAIAYTAEAWLWCSSDDYPPKLVLVATECNKCNPTAALKELGRTLKQIEKFKEASNA